MHTEPMADSQGDFSDAKPTDHVCKHCGTKTIVEQMWESHCGGYEDYKYTCTTCGHGWWEEGIDS